VRMPVRYPAQLRRSQEVSLCRLSLVSAVMGLWMSFYESFVALQMLAGNLIARLIHYTSSASASKVKDQHHSSRMQSANQHAKESASHHSAGRARTPPKMRLEPRHVSPGAKQSAANARYHASDTPSFTSVVSFPTASHILNDSPSPPPDNT
jgi:predicted lipid-binding transport protein (Tim44 family)